MDYGDKPAAAKWSHFTPPQWSLFAPPLTIRATGLFGQRRARPLVDLSHSVRYRLKFEHAGWNERFLQLFIPEFAQCDRPAVNGQ